MRRFPLSLGFGLVWSVAQVSAATFPLIWRWSNPTPHGNNIIDVAYTNQFWIQVAERGQVYTSGDMLTWTPRDSHTTRALRAVTFYQDRIVVVGENGTIVSGPSASELNAKELGTADWLEGVAASAQLAVAVGDNAAIYRSTDGQAWERQSVPFNDWLRSVAYGTPGGVGTFCAVGEAGFVATSTDGHTWRTQPRLTALDLNRAAWFSGEFWIVGDGGAVFQSSSGTAWTSAVTGATNVLNAFAGQNSMRVVAGESEARLRTGPSTWKSQLAGANTSPVPDWTYLSAAAETNTFLLCGRTGMMVQGISTQASDLVWEPISESLRNWLWDIKRFPRLYLAVGDRATILSSIDGIDWAAELPPDLATNSIFLGIGGKTNRAVAVGNGGVILTSLEGQQSVVSTNRDGSIVTNEVSTLGIFWNAVQPRPTTNDLQGVTVFGDQFVVSGGSGTILTSPDAITWTRRDTPTVEFLSSVEAFPGGVVAVGRAGVILTSPDAITWTARLSGTTNWIYRVRFTGGQLVAAGQNGTLLTSTNGQDWQRRDSGVTHWLNDVQWLDNTFFAVGNQGTVLTSSDAVTWSDRGTITGKSLFGAATAGGMLVTVGVEGIILRSQVAAVTTPIQFLRYPARAEESVFLFAGQTGQRFTLERSADLRSWTPGPNLELDTSGTLLFLDGGTNNAPYQFFRAPLKP